MSFAWYFNPEARPEAAGSVAARRFEPSRLFKAPGVAPRRPMTTTRPAAPARDALPSASTQPSGRQLGLRVSVQITPRPGRPRDELGKSIDDPSGAARIVGLEYKSRAKMLDGLVSGHLVLIRVGPFGPLGTACRGASRRCCKMLMEATLVCVSQISRPGPIKQDDGMYSYRQPLAGRPCRKLRALYRSSPRGLGGRRWNPLPHALEKEVGEGLASSRSFDGNMATWRGMPSGFEARPTVPLCTACGLRTDRCWREILYKCHAESSRRVPNARFDPADIATCSFWGRWRDAPASCPWSVGVPLHERGVQCPVAAVVQGQGHNTLKQTC